MILKKCLVCKKDIIPNHKSHNYSKRKYCSKKCYSNIRNKNFIMNGLKTRFKKGLSPELYFQWKGGKHMSWNGYVIIYSPNHPLADNKKYVREHRLVAEKILGRYLLKTERIHHINGIKNDNRPENLYLFASDSEHFKFHWRPYNLSSNII